MANGHHLRHRPAEVVSHQHHPFQLQCLHQVRDPGCLGGEGVVGVRRAGRVAQTQKVGCDAPPPVLKPIDDLAPQKAGGGKAVEEQNRLVDAGPLVIVGDPLGAQTGKPFPET